MTLIDKIEHSVFIQFKDVWTIMEENDLSYAYTAQLIQKAYIRRKKTHVVPDDVNTLTGVYAYDYNEVKKEHAEYPFTLLYYKDVEKEDYKNK
jgi:hypothetical protein